MRPLADCPSPQKWKDLHEGCVPFSQAESLAIHLEHCETCVRIFQSLPGEDTLVGVLRAKAIFPDQGDTVIENLMVRLRKLREVGTSTSTADDAASPAIPLGVEEAYRFLGPPQGPDERGRLGPYRILDVLGAGGMGIVFRAADTRLNRQVALKVIKPEKMQSSDVQKRFLREAQAIAQLEHENIVTIHHVDEVNGVPFLAMPLLRGESLDNRLRGADGPLPLQETLRIGREIASGLAAAHDRGFVHRDIKPSNVFLATANPSAAGDRTVDGDNPDAKNRPVKAIILDFGLVRDVGSDESSLSQHGQIIGSPAYMAPEQGRGDSVDHRADLFSVGCILYRMATGSAPFRAADTVALLLAIALDEPPRPSELNPGLPSALVQLIDQLLAKNPAQRPHSAHAVVEAIQAIESKLAPAHKPRRSRTQLGFATAAGLLIGVVSVVAWFMSFPAPTVNRQIPVDPPQAHVPFAGEIGKVTFGSAVTGVAASPRKHESTFLASCLDQNGALGVWDGKSEVAKFPPLDEALPPMECVAFAPDGIHAASACKKANPRQELAIYFWDIRKSRPKVVTRTGPLDSPVKALAYSPDGKRLLSGDAGGTAKLWNLDGGDQAPIALEGHTDGVTSVAFSTDGKKGLSAGLDKQVIVWDIDGAKIVQRLTDHPAKVRSAVFGPGPNDVTTAGQDGIIRIWDPNKKTDRALRGHVGAVNCIAVSPDGRRLLSGGEDGTVRLWDVKTGREIDPSSPFKLSTEAIYGVAFTPDGQKAICGGGDRMLRLLKLPD